MTTWAVVSLLVSLADAAGAQQARAVRSLGSIERVSAVPLSSVAAALLMPGGRVLVNDITGHRVLLLDSTLATATLVADTTAATANAYGRDAGTLIRFRGDTALYIDPSSLSMLVLDPSGKIARVMAVPRPDEAPHLIGAAFGTPGVDARGRLVYYGTLGRNDGMVLLCCVGRAHATQMRPAGLLEKSDSAIVRRVNLDTHAVDTAATFKIAIDRQVINADAQGLFTSVQTTSEPFPVVDDWTMLPDGAIAVLRGRDYHLDLLSADGRWTSFPKMPFGWQHVDDVHKSAIIDSSSKAEQAMLDRIYAQMVSSSPGRGGRGGGRGGGGAPAMPGGMVPIPMIAGRPESSAIPDYMPAFKAGAVTSDADGNIWVRTTAMSNGGQPIYDIVNRRGEVVDRVQLPPFRTIAGFAPGRVFMAVKDDAGNVHLERVRIR
jgi:hypothetical protein